MQPQGQRATLLVIAFLLTGLAIGCGNAAEQANKLAGEGQKLDEAASKSLQDALAIHLKLFSEDNVLGFPKNREQLKGEAQLEIDALNKSAGGFRDAASKYDEASKLRVDDKLKQYLSLRAQESRKGVEQSEGTRTMAQTVLDDSIKTLDVYVIKLADTRTLVAKAAKEQQDIRAQADKLRAESQGKIK